MHAACPRPSRWNRPTHTHYPPNEPTQPKQATYLARLTSLGSRLALVALRCLLFWPGAGYSIAALLLHDLCLWGLVGLPLFTASFTLGEAMVLTQALSLLAADVLACTLVKAGVLPLGAHLLPTGAGGLGPGGRLDRDPVLLVLECGLLGGLLAGVCVVKIDTCMREVDRWIDGWMDGWMDG
jgi:hypothetical protein